MAASQELAVSVADGLNVPVAAAIWYQLDCATGVVTAAVVNAVQPAAGVRFPKLFPMPSAIPRITRSLALVVVIDGADAGLVVPACLVVWSIASDTPLNSVRVIHMPPAVAAVTVTGVEEVSVATSTAPYQISMCVFVVDDWALNQLPTPPPVTPDRDPVEVPPIMISTLPAVVVGALVKGTGSDVAEAAFPLTCWTNVMAADAVGGITPRGATQSSAANPHRASGRDRTIAFISSASPGTPASLRRAAARYRCARRRPSPRRGARHS